MKTDNIYLERNEGTILLNKPPETRPKTSVAMLFALPNLSHLVKANAFVIVSAIAMITRIKDKNSNFKIANTARAIQRAGEAYSMIQKTFESIGFIYLSGSEVSKTHILPPLSSVSFHQRKPTNNRPLMFLTFQKSAASSNITVMKRNILCYKISRQHLI